MVSIDNRFNDAEMDILRQMIGRKIVSFRHTDIPPRHAAYGALGIETEQGMIYLYCETDNMNYFGYVDDEAVLTLTHECRSWLDMDQYSYVFAGASPVNDTVKEIHVVQDHQRLYENGEQTFDIWLAGGSYLISAIISSRLKNRRAFQGSYTLSREMTSSTRSQVPKSLKILNSGRIIIFRNVIGRS